MDGKIIFDKNNNNIEKAIEKTYTRYINYKNNNMGKEVNHDNTKQGKNRSEKSYTNKGKEQKEVNIKKNE